MADDLEAALVELARRKEALEGAREEVEPDTAEEARLDGKLAGLHMALDAFADVQEYALPEWSVAIEDAEDEWEWYYPHALTREDAIADAKLDAREELGDGLNVYEVGGPNVA